MVVRSILLNSYLRSPLHQFPFAICECLGNLSFKYLFFYKGFVKARMLWQLTFTPVFSPFLQLLQLSLSVEG